MDQHETYYQINKNFEQSGEYVFILEREPYQHRTTEIRDFGKSIIWTGGERSEHENVGLPLEISPISIPRWLKQKIYRILIEKASPLNKGGEDVKYFR